MRNEAVGSAVSRIHERTRMNPLLYVAAVFSFGAVAVTICAFLTAADGFEDESGFHAVEPRVSPQSFTDSAPEEEGVKLPPLISANHR